MPTRELTCPACHFITKVDTAMPRWTCPNCNAENDSPPARRPTADKAKRNMVITVLVVAGIIAVLTVAVVTGDGGTGSSGDDATCTMPACKLATIDASGPMSDGDAGIVPYQTALDAFAPYCRDDETRLGDFAVASQQLLANGGQTETLLDVLQHVRASIPSRTPEMNSCSSLFAAYVTLRGGKAA